MGPPAVPDETMIPVILELSQGGIMFSSQNSLLGRDELQ
jgi:hypothetical protein